MYLKENTLFLFVRLMRQEIRTVPVTPLTGNCVGYKVGNKGIILEDGVYISSNIPLLVRAMETDLRNDEEILSAISKFIDKAKSDANGKGIS